MVGVSGAIEAFYLFQWCLGALLKEESFSSSAFRDAVIELAISEHSILRYKLECGRFGSTQRDDRDFAKHSDERNILQDEYSRAGETQVSVVWLKLFIPITNNNLY